MLFVKTPDNLQLRTISPNKTGRVGLHEARTGETVRGGLGCLDRISVFISVALRLFAYADVDSAGTCSQ